MFIDEANEEDSRIVCGPSFPWRLRTRNQNPIRSQNVLVGSSPQPGRLYESIEVVVDEAAIPN